MQAARNNWFDALILAMFCILLTDIALFGPGLVLPGLGISIRRLLFVGIFALLIFRQILSARALTVAQVMLLAAFTCMAILWALAIPASYGFPGTDSVADALPWAMLLLLAFWPWDAWPGLDQWRTFCRYVLRLSLALAVAHLAVWGLLTSGLLSSAALAVATAMISGGDVADSFIRISLMGEEGLHRVYWSSSIFLLCGLYFLVTDPRPKLRLGWILSLCLLVFALWVTQIRAFIGAAAIFIALAPALRLARTPFLSGSSAAGVLFIWFVAIVSVSAAISPTLLEFINLSRDVSDVARVDQANALTSAFVAHPLFGMGFGSYTTAVVRSAESPFSYELVFYALMMKIGILGFVALAFALFCSLNIVRLDRFARLHRVRHSHWVAFTTGFWFAGSTNPIVVNFVGMGVLLLLLIDARYFSEAPRSC